MTLPQFTPNAKLRDGTEVYCWQHFDDIMYVERDGGRYRVDLLGFSPVCNISSKQNIVEILGEKTEAGKV